MSQRNTIKAMILSVLIVAGSAMTSEADGSGYFASVPFMSSALTVILQAAKEVHSFIAEGHGGPLFFVGG